MLNVMLVQCSSISIVIWFMTLKTLNNRSPPSFISWGSWLTNKKSFEWISKEIIALNRDHFFFLVCSFVVRYEASFVNNFFILFCMSRSCCATSHTTFTIIKSFFQFIIQFFSHSSSSLFFIAYNLTTDEHTTNQHHAECDNVWSANNIKILCNQLMKYHNSLFV